MKKGELAHLATPGAVLNVRVTPRAARNAGCETSADLRVSVTAAPAGGKANAAVVNLLAAALGIPKSALTLTRGAASRDKTFRIH